MTRSDASVWRRIVKATGFLAVFGAFSAAGLHGCESGGVGDPCIPEDEYKQNFAGFKLSEENIESRSFQCQTRICLVNHFQGRVSCPNGQPTPINCSDNESACDGDTECQEAGVILTDCDPTDCGEEGADQSNCNGHPDCGGGACNLACGGNACDQAGRFCKASSGQCPSGYVFDGERQLCVIKVCAPSSPDRSSRCYVPGTDDPVAVPVCPQCAQRTAETAVYCSCRCGGPDENPSDADENFNFCDCPDGYVCSEIRKNVGLGDAQIAGKYCVLEDSVYTPGNDIAACGEVVAPKGDGQGSCTGNAPSGS
jgi:hypothetical protein